MKDKHHKQQKPPELVIYTDLDGTLLDRKDYSYDKAVATVNYLKNNNIPLIFCSAKTRSEQEYYREKLGIYDPFIVENGGAVFIPRDYFPFKYDYDTEKNGYNVIELGISSQDIRQKIETIRRDGISIVGFGDMTAEEIASITGLSTELAARAKAREYDETIIPFHDGYMNDIMLKSLRRAGLYFTSGGQFYEVMGNNDKGKSIKILTKLFKKKLGRVITAGIGDNLNDLPMLQEVDLPYLVQKPDGKWENIAVPNLQYAEGIGPSGWIKAVNIITSALIT